MLAYSWISFGLLIYAHQVRTELYLYAINDILICGVENDIQELSYYGNKKFIDNTWRPAYNYFIDMLSGYGWWFYPIILDLLTGGLWEIVQIPINIGFMLSTAVQSDGFIKGIRERSCYTSDGNLVGYGRVWEHNCQYFDGL